MELDLLNTQAVACFNLRRLGFDEQAQLDMATRAHLSDRQNLSSGALYVEAAFGSALFTPFRNQSHHVRADALRNLHHLGGGRHFQVQERGETSAQSLHIVIPNVSAIFPEVRNNPISAGKLAELRRKHRVWVQEVTLIS